jgi:F-type H+-transporting ATPase subunit delta
LLLYIIIILLITTLSSAKQRREEKKIIMQNPRLAARYAKSLLDLAVERNSLDAVLEDMKLMQAICQQSPEFEVMLRSPVISSDKKLNVLKLVLAKYNINVLTNAFINLLVAKGRESNLYEMTSAFVEQYNTLKRIRIVKLTTAAPMGEAVRSSIMRKIAGYMPNDTVDMKTEIDESLIGGFVLEVEDKLYDASVKKSLNDIRTKLVDHSYESKL